MSQIIFQGVPKPTAGTSLSVSTGDAFTVASGGIAIVVDQNVMIPQLEARELLSDIIADGFNKGWLAARDSTQLGKFFEVTSIEVSSEAPSTPAFRFSMKTDGAGLTTSSGDQFELPLQSDGSFNFDVDWGDGNSDTITAYDDAAARHTYASAGVYSVSIVGSISGWSFNAGGDAGKMLRVSEWGPLRFGGSGEFAFYDCGSMEVTATDTLDLSGETNLANTFNFCDAVTSIHLGNVAPYDIATMFNAGGLARLDASNWDVKSLNVATLFLSGTTLPVADYNSLLINWAAQSLVQSVAINFGSAQYTETSSAAAARNILVNSYGWTITDGGQSSDPGSTSPASGGPAAPKSTHVPSGYSNRVFYDHFVNSADSIGGMQPFWTEYTRGSSTAYVAAWDAWGTSLLYGNGDKGWKDIRPGETHVMVDSGIALRSTRIDSWSLEIPGWYTPATAADSVYYLNAAMLSTENGFNVAPPFYFEMDVTFTNVPSGHHMAFWFLNKNADWPPEIDILERVRGQMSEGVSFNYHWGTSENKQDTFEWFPETANVNSGFVRFGVLVDSSNITWYVDGVLKKQAPHYSEVSTMYLLATWEISNFWAGNIDPSTADFGECIIGFWEVWRQQS